MYSEYLYKTVVAHPVKDVPPRFSDLQRMIKLRCSADVPSNLCRNCPYAELKVLHIPMEPLKVNIRYAVGDFLNLLGH